MENASALRHQALLDELGHDWRAQEMRDFASTILKLADSIDQQWDPSNLKSVFRWPSRAHRIEKNSLNLAFKARQIYEHRQRRADHIPKSLLGEPAWDMLLELFMQFAGRAKVSVTSLCLASNTPTTTALRYIELLEREGLINRCRSNTDRRVTFIELTDMGFLAIGGWLDTI